MRRKSRIIRLVPLNRDQEEQKNEKLGFFNRMWENYWDKIREYISLINSDKELPVLM